MRSRGISSQIAVPFALFVVVGSLGLAIWLTLREQTDSRRGFEILATTNARFLERSSYPPSQQIADELSEVLKVDVLFGTPKKPLTGVLPVETARVEEIGHGREAVLVNLRQGEKVLFTRDRLTFGAQLFRASTLLPLVVFWAVSLLLAGVISRRLVRPLRLLAGEVNALEATHGRAAVFPGEGREDELGQLARALHKTHANLIDERARREEGERAALLGKMATGLAHEIRNPVAAIRLHAQLMEGCSGCGESGATIIAEAETVEGLVNQWMFLSKPDPPEKRRQDVGACLRRCLEGLGAVAKHSGVRIKTLLPTGLDAEIDSARIGQVFRNIALNAIQAMASGGVLEVEGRSSGERLEFVFSDNGSGFSGEATSRYGELFFSTKEGGMGVGLSVTAEIVSAHGGELSVANRDQGGAVVTIRIPIKSDRSGT